MMGTRCRRLKRYGNSQDRAVSFIRWGKTPIAFHLINALRKCAQGSADVVWIGGINMVQKGRRGIWWNLPSVSADGLKNFACVMMLIQSVGIVVIEHGLIHLENYTQQELSLALEKNSDLMVLAGVGSVMQLLGGMALPLFAFLLAEGFRHTSSYRKYLFSMLAFAVISEIPYDLAMGQRLADPSSQNPLFAMVISLLMIYFLHMVQEIKGAFGLLARVGIVFGAVVWAALFKTQYGLCLVLLAAVFDVFHDRNLPKMLLGILISLLYVTGPLAFYGIWCYSGERKDRIPKYAYYAFYPLHLLVLALIVKIMQVCSFVPGS